MVEGKENEQQEAPAMTTRTTRILRMMLVAWKKTFSPR
jgi:hypothetical protein